jgi:LacI family transcriptional regulator
VVVDRPLAGASTDAVVVGSRRGAADATSHLLDQGYERVACITGPSSVSTAEDRLAGYLDTLRDRGLLQQRLVEQANFKVGGGRAAADRLLSMPDPPDGLFVANSLMAIGALEALRDRGLRAGRDVGIVAFDDAPWGEVIDPPMTVIAQPAYDIGRASGELLRERISGAIRRPRTFTLTTELIVRDSSRR